MREKLGSTITITNRKWIILQFKLLELWQQKSVVFILILKNREYYNFYFIFTFNQSAYRLAESTLQGWKLFLYVIDQGN